MPDLVNSEIIDLLREREREFLNVWRYESAIHEILGVPFPIPPPPALPSMQKRKRKGKVKATKKQKGPNIRRLNDDVENAYRILFTFTGEEHTTYQNSPELVRGVLKMVNDDFQIISVETGMYVSKDEFKPIEVIWERE